MKGTKHGKGCYPKQYGGEKSKIQGIKILHHSEAYKLINIAHQYGLTTKLQPMLMFLFR